MPPPPTAPLYRQITDLLVRQIASGTLIAGERLPPERELAQTHRVAVGTVRKSLRELQAQGLIERRHGSGNYVRGVRDIGGLYGFFRLEPPGGEGRPDARLIAFDLRPKPSDAPDFGEDPQAFRIRRLRSLDGTAAALEEIWLDRARGSGLTRDVITPSLYNTYRTHLSLRIVRVEDRIGVAGLPDWADERLAQPVGTLMGHVERLAWAQDGTPCEFSRTWFDSDKVRYVNRLK
ncbi:GntR family transcriptional regulator [Maribius pontilimi]|uniref:GntR family transcriptional regulator n=1 Tax=Palleronia pontilimi TaxID=1964209 RepID=A0A934M9P4_9RHOB|nr:GntR family transcriptional regulator [Palleronia pontilimi]MBJ3762767.1 GntR family transcriptional regulator [Palleronia pontilimi]